MWSMTPPAVEEAGPEDPSSVEAVVVATAVGFKPTGPVPEPCTDPPPDFFGGMTGLLGGTGGGTPLVAIELMPTTVFLGVGGC